MFGCLFFFFKQKTAYEMRISDWSSDVCSSDLPQDRWEENAGISPFTLGVEIAALVAAADGLPSKDRTYALSLADYWNERLEDWLYTEAGASIGRASGRERVCQYV